MNNAQFTGNLTKDCVVRQGATAMCFFTIAVNSGFGEKKHTDYVDCAIFGKQAEGGLVPYLIKGKMVGVTGDIILKTREHEGKTYSNLNLSVHRLDLLGGNTEPTQQQAPAQQAAKVDQFDDDIPF